MIALATTKLHPPQLRGNHMPRPRLLAQLDAALDSDIVLICAPAGYGKTTLAADWLRRPTAGRAAWVSLDEGDNHLDPFLRYVIAAVRMACEDEQLCSNTLSLLDAVHEPAVSVFAETLIAELSALDAPLTLALDDYHLLADPAIRLLMRTLIQRSPSQLRLLLITRSDPERSLLVRLRAEGRIAEIRASDLRFVDAEARAVLERTAGTPVSDEAAELLQTETEGWIVGLQMVGLSLRGQLNQMPSARAFQEQGSSLVMEYLLEEVLAQQSDQLQTFLLRTSILESFCAELCAAVSAELAEARDAQAHLDYLSQANLFLQSLDAHGKWYRYHTLFRALLYRNLQSQVSEDEIAGLHRQAGKWFAEHGLIEEALRHLVRGGDAIGAAILVESLRHDILNTQQVNLLERWLSLLPDAIVNARPALLQLKAWLLRVHFKLPAVVPLLDQAESMESREIVGADQAEAEMLQGERDALRSEIAFWQGDIETSLWLAQSALARLPTSFYFARGLPALYQILGLHISGNTERALILLNEMLDDERSQPLSFKGRLLVAASGIYGASGDLWRLQQTGDYLLRASLAENNPLDIGWAHFYLGHVCYQLDRLQEATAHWSTVQELRYHTHFRTYHEATLGLALIQQLQGDPHGAQETLATLAQFLLQMNQSQLAPEIDAFRARLALLNGDHALAIHWVETGIRPAHIPLWFWETSDLTRIKVHLARANSADLQEAERMLTAGEQDAVRTRHAWLLIQVWALRAILATKQGRPDDALDAARQALRLAEPGGYIRLLVDVGAELMPVLERLAATNQPTPYLQRLLRSSRAQRASLVEMLSDREWEVLALLRQKLTDREIAQQLFLSVLTVKKHNRNIYRKLGVSGRQQAVTKATELGLFL